MRRGLGTTCSVSALALEGHAGDDGGHEDWMFKNAALAAWLVPTLACTAAADMHQDGPFVTAPGVTGTFNVTLDAISGCAGTGLLAWAGGALLVDGAAGWRLDGALRARPPEGSCEQRADFVAQMGTP